MQIISMINLWPGSCFAYGQETETCGAVIDANEIIALW